jgi:hypothetical protein
MTPVYVGLAAGGIGLVGAIVFAAFKADAQSKADGNAAQIRSSAIQRGYDGDGDGVPDAKGVCGSSDPTIQKDFSTACTTLKENNDKVDTNATIANVSVVVLVLGLCTAAGWYLFAPKRDDSRSSKAKPLPSGPVLTPYAGYGSGGLTLSGSF